MPFDAAKCEGCLLDGQFRPMEPRGGENARFMIVTEVPSGAGHKEGRLLPPAAMRIFGATMEQAGFNRDDFLFYPSCRCPIPENDYTNREKSTIIKHCRAHMHDAIADAQPEVIVPLGKDPTSQVFGRSVKITHVRGLMNEIADVPAPVFPIITPSQVVAYPQNGPLFEADVQSFARFVEFNYDAASASVEHGDYQIVDDLQFLIDRDEELLSFDMETTGIRWYKQGVDVRTYNPELHKGNAAFDPRYQILTFQFSTRPGEGFMLVWDHPENPIPEERKPKLRNQLRKLLCKADRLVGGHNDKFDNVGLWMTEGIRYRICWDTLLAVAMLDENAPEKNLDVMTKIHVPEMAGYADEFNRTVDKSRMWEVPLDMMRGYGCGDTDAALRLWLALEPKLMADDRQWSNYCNVGIPGLNALSGMETRGMYVDVENELPQFQAYMEDSVGTAYTRLLGQIPRTIKREHVDALKGDVEKALSFGRKDFLRDVLFYHPDGFKLKPRVFTKSTRHLNDKNLWIPSTSSKDHLPYFFEECPFTFELAEYVKDERLLSTNIISFEKKYVVGGKVRPVYNLHIAVTGRTASQDPNGQNYPKRSDKAKMYRRMFNAPEGYYVCELDLSQAELRIAATMARDPTMLQIYREAGDIHTATALVVLSMTMEQFRQLPKAEQKLARTKAKSVNFGFLYGMGWRNFIVFAKTQYNVEFTEQEAKNIRAGFFKKYSRLTAWHERMRNFAKEHKFVRSLSGRIRHLPMVDSAEEYIQQEAMRQAINSPVQEFGSSLGVMALGRMEEVIDPEYLQIVGFIHDAIVVYIKKEYLDWGLKTVKGFMESNPIGEWFGSEMLCPIVADAGFGTNLGEIHELEGFSLDQQFDYGSLRDKEGNLLIEVPPQQTPPNNGRLTRSPFTLDTDLEPEEIRPATRRVMRSLSRAPDPAPRRPTRIVRTPPAQAAPVEQAPATVKRYTRTPVR
jgi:uracil-DNA glycosylase family 4